MELQIKMSAQLSDVQKQFNTYFPYLRIDFFKFPHKERKLSPDWERLDRFTTVCEVVKWTDDKVIEINELHTVNQFESIMADTGLFVQVLRKSGRVWIETSHTDNWTLNRQNKEGEMLGGIHDAENGK